MTQKEISAADFYQGFKLSTFSSSEEGKKIIDNLPEKVKSGSIFIEDGDGMLYFTYLLSFMVFFVITLFITEKILKMTKNEAYMSRDDAAKARYVHLYWENIHHFTVPFMALYFLYYSCRSDNDWEKTLGDGTLSKDLSVEKHFLWFRSDVCLFQPQRGYVLTVLFSIAYLFIDIFAMKIQILDPNRLTQLSYLHHTLAITGFSASFFVGYGLPGISACSLLCEISGMFLNYKDMFTKETRNTPIAQVNQFTFFFTYTIFRVILFPFLCFKIFQHIFSVWVLLDGLRRALLIFCQIQAIFVLALNLYWYALILKGLKRLLQEVGVFKKSQQEQYDVLDQYEAFADVKKIESSDSKEKENETN